MDHVEAAGWVAHDREALAVTMAPRTARCTFKLLDGREEVLSYDQLVAEGERLWAVAAERRRPPRWAAFHFEFDDLGQVR